ncbi:hypothetical protein GPECTOR_1g441 [Gonium pectorale]|uniref:Protein kinase domain-containing protein n=1 Tax=Gonium pectorale TaxID=33097 RepID=A0A150H3A6_GONPE|nr:hypothetical protein GPECTOR_1g441 [Gonium pectorale]|eukprot:KXZ56493.1 hypothetical protein GPECTOR_1g441 [Gonium pectorale]
MFLPLWTFTFDRFLSRPPPLRLRNVTLVVPPAELALLRGLLEDAGALPSAEEGHVQGCRLRFGTPRSQGIHNTPLDRAIERSQASLAKDGNDGGAVRLVEAIGKGSCGVVYLGVWRGLAVAAKVLVVHDTLLGAEGRARQRAVLEAAVGASLDHPNVVATYAYDVRPLGEQPSDGGDEGGSDPRVGGSSQPDVYQLHILQEFCIGGSLKEALESGCMLGGGALEGGVSAALALRLAFDVAAGLRHVHAAGIVHGDVSAGNVLLARRDMAEEGSAPPSESCGVDPREAEWRARLAAASPPPLRVVAKVADFGLSVRLPGSATHASGLHQGTPTYMAPEVHARGHVSRASDVFSFGVLLLELLCGMPVAAVWEAAAPKGAVDQSTPDGGHETHTRLLLAILRESLRGSGGAGRCPAGLRALLEACLATDPAGRPTMEQVAEALVGCVEALLCEQG